MGLFVRKDSPFFWFGIEGTTIRKGTGVPIDGGSPQKDKELRRQALDLYATAKAKHALDRAGLVTTLPAITFAEYVRWYEPNVASHQRGYAKAKSMLKTLRAAFGPQLLTAIDAHAVRHWMTRRLTTVQPRTVNRELDVLKAILNAAVPKYLERSPLSVVRRFRAPETEPRMLTREEESRLLARADDELHAIIVVALDTLLRLSNLVQLKWPQVKPAIIVPLNAKVAHDQVPITTRMRAAIDRLPKRSVYVFAGLHDAKRGGPQAAKNRLTRQFAALCLQADVKHSRAAEGITFHCLRHTGASRALAAGASVRTVMKLGGWKDLRSVLRYTHVSDVDVREAAESIGPAHVSRTGRNR